MYTSHVTGFLFYFDYMHDECEFVLNVNYMKMRVYNISKRGWRLIGEGSLIHDHMETLKCKSCSR